MFGKLQTAGLLVLILFASIFAGAVAATTDGPYTLTVITKEGANEIVADKVTITNKDTGVVAREATNEKSPSFSLPVGVYQVTTEKADYSTDTQYVSMYDGNQKIEALLVAQPSNGGNDGGSNDNGGNDSSGGTTISSDLYVKHFSFDDKVAPGDTVDFKVNVKDSASYDASNVQVTVTIQSIDDGDDLDVTSDTFDLDSKDDKDVTLSLVIPTSADDKSYTVEAKVEWEDANGKDLSAVKNDTLTVEKVSHAVKITDVQLDSDTTQAGAQGQIAVTMDNIGKNDETVRFQVKSDQLGVNVMSAQFALKEGKETTQQVPFTIADNAKPGKYFVYVTAYYGSLTTQSFVTLEVKAPSTATPAATGPVTVTPVTVTTASGNEATTPATAGGIVGWIIAALVLIAIVGMLVKDVLPVVTAKPTIIKASKR